MKKTGLTITLFVFFLFPYIGIRGQTVQSGLDQLKLMEKFVGTWQLVANSDTVLMEIQKYGKAFVENDYIVKAGKKVWGSIWTYGFSPDEGKFRIFAVQVTGDYLTVFGSFTSENKWVQEIVQNFTPDKVLQKGEFEFITPTVANAAAYNSAGIKTEEYTVTKIK